MEFLPADSFKVLSNPGVNSTQLLAPYNSASTRVTLTRVEMAPGAVQKRHVHGGSEQIWIVLAGAGELLLADDGTHPIQAGDVARFADGDVHGLHNTGTETFVYLSVTSPPLDFGYAYKEERKP